MSLAIQFSEMKLLSSGSDKSETLDMKMEISQVE